MGEAQPAFLQPVVLQLHAAGVRAGREIGATNEFAEPPFTFHQMAFAPLRRALRDETQLSFAACLLRSMSAFLEFPGMNVAFKGPNSSFMTSGIFERLQITVIWTIALQHPCPPIQDHLKLNIPRDQQRLAKCLCLVAKAFFDVLKSAAAYFCVRYGTQTMRPYRSNELPVSIFVSTTRLSHCSLTNEERKALDSRPPVCPNSGASINPNRMWTSSSDMSFELPFNS